jgi:(E)-4-hydroxy-3-methylbut-2-enyl-diphosphate synthase
VTATAPPKRRRTRTVQVGPLALGGSSPVRVQSMTKVPLGERARLLRQIREMVRAGCEIVRVALPDRGALKDFAELRQRTDVPLVADIHFDHRLALAAIDAGADKVRINPGNIGGPARMRLVAEKAEQAGCAVRIGVNAGSLEKGILKRYGGPVPEALVESAAAAVGHFEEAGCRRLVLSLKASSVPATIAAYRLASRRFSYPLHLGVTEAGWGRSGTIKSAVGIGTLLADGIGDTVRVSLTASPREEIRVAYEILAALGLRRQGVEIISCPTCGRCRFDLSGTARAVQRRLSTVEKPLTVAVMGCAVNGPGEARAADVGLAGGKGRAVIFRRGRVLKTVAESEMIQALEETVRGEVGETPAPKAKKGKGGRSRKR